MPAAAPAWGYSRQLLNRRPALAGVGVGMAVVLRGDLPVAAEWRTYMAKDARVLGDPGTWSGRMLDRLVAAAETPGSGIRFVDDGVAILLVGGSGRIRRMTAGPEAGHLPDPAYLEDAVTLESVEASLGG